jgi:hypothetical protein
MKSNVFVPSGLPLLTDRVLLLTIEEYQRAHSVFTASPAAREVRRQIVDAVRLIAKELRARGVRSTSAAEPVAEAPARAGLRRRVISSSQTAARP